MPLFVASVAPSPPRKSSSKCRYIALNKIFTVFLCYVIQSGKVNQKIRVVEEIKEVAGCIAFSKTKGTHNDD